MPRALILSLLLVGCCALSPSAPEPRPHGQPPAHGSIEAWFELHARAEQLSEQKMAAREDRARLAKKIEALTDLEAAISNRKEN